MLLQRILSSLVMIPVALAAVWFGGIAFALLCSVVAFAIIWEWTRMVTGGAFGLGVGLIALLMAAASLTVLVDPILAFILLAIGLVAALLVSSQPKSWALAAVVYAGLPVLSLVWLRENEGLVTVVWLFLVVWATDIGAYIFGRIFGGKLLLPSVSPKKTWAGLFGGMICAAIVCIAMVRFWDGFDLFLPMLTGVVLAVVAQVGDFFESWVKRRWNAKDSSQLIPGHGGVMDRVDGLLTVTVLVAILTVLQVL